MLSQIQHESNLIGIEECEAAIIKAIVHKLEEEDDWSDLLDAAEYILGDSEQVRELRELVNETHGLDIQPFHSQQVQEVIDNGN